MSCTHADYFISVEGSKKSAFGIAGYRIATSRDRSGQVGRILERERTPCRLLPGNDGGV
jgi:hypothetical protein